MNVVTFSGNVASFPCTATHWSVVVTTRTQNQDGRQMLRLSGNLSNTPSRKHNSVWLKGKFRSIALLIEIVIPPPQMPDYQAKKKQCKELRQKLFHIKRLVKVYDQGIC